MNDDLARKIDPNCHSVKALREAIQKNQVQYRDMEEQRRLRDLARESLVRDNQIPLPPSQVASRIRRLVEDEARQRVRQGQTEEQVKAALPELQKQANEAAQAQLRAEYVLDAIARTEKIELTDADIQPQLDYYASAFRRDAGWVRRMFEREGHMDALYNAARENKALDLVIAQAQMTES